jgi:DNA modification methylase
MTSIEGELYGVDLFGDPATPESRGIIADRFLVPPFSVLNAAEGFWQERKRAWVSMGIKSELGRGGDLAFNTGVQDWFGKDGTSVFDPVLCELVYRWFAPQNGTVLDPFAGGSVRGIVAHKLNMRYYGVELRREQVDANREQGEDICGPVAPTWVCGDSMTILDGENVPESDLVFSCPPYGDLEKYSDDPADISTMEYHTFMAAYRRIIMRSVRHLRDNRFACFVVGDFRDKRTGFYRNFVSDTIAAFRDVGLELYNEVIMVTPRGSLPIRITKQFQASRKIGKTHQNVLVFVKGDPREAAKACAPLG